MHAVDWAIVGAYLVWIVWDGIRLSKNSNEIEGYFLASRSLPWWAAGLSVMATQLSAITMIGTTGQAFDNGMRFLQFYFALPVAMVVLSLTLVPFFHQARVYTAYEYLERRFDAKTRALTSLLFLISRALACGVIISAPAVVLSVVFGWNLTLTCLAIGLPTAVYTMFGGVQAVAWTDVKQIVLIVFALVAVFVALAAGLPDGISIGDALHVAGATGRLQTFDFSFDLTQPYTFWSGTIAALFLFLAYFGTDQSQVQRYLTTGSVDEARTSLLMSAYWKIPLQALVLLVGVFMFLFYLFAPQPMLFNRIHEERLRQGPSAQAYGALEQRFETAHQARRDAADGLVRDLHDPASGDSEAAKAALQSAEATMAGLRREAAQLVRQSTGDRTYTDVNYVFPTYVITWLPVGLIGLVIAGIFAAAMSSISAELAALSTASVIDFYRRFFRVAAPDAHYLMVSKVATGFWGLVACVAAIYAAELGSLIEVVNRFGSFFYGSLLGVFVLAIGVKWATPLGAFIGLLAGMAAVGLVASTTSIAFLWYNVVGTVAVVVVGMAVSVIDRAGRRATAA